METNNIHEDALGLKDEAKNAVSAVIHFFKGDTNKISDRDKIKNYMGGSISQYSKNLIMTFPVLCDNTLSPETASMISKANERNVTTMLQLLFTAMNIEANDGMKVIAKIHNNISTSMDVYDVMNKMDDIAGGLANKSASVASGKSIFETVKGNYDKESQVIAEMMSELKGGKLYAGFPVESLSENSLNNFLLNKTYRGLYITEMTDTQRIEFVNKVASYLEGEIWKSFGTKMTSEEMYNYFTSEEFGQTIRDVADMCGFKIKMSASDMANLKAEIANELKNRHVLSDIELNKLKAFEIERNNMVRLIDTDVKKANELQPTILQINYSQKKSNGDLELRSFLAGVKSRLVPVSSTDIVERVIAKNKTKLNFFNFIRATSGEIGFFRDFLFAIDQAKLDSKNAVKKGEAAMVWNCLANRAANNNKNKLKKLGNDASAITVLVLSQETVNYMKNIHKFDLEKMNNTKMVCDAYNLMGIIIADESIEVIKSFYVGNNGYEQIAYSMLERENKNGDYKKIVNLLGKTNVR